MHSPDTWPRLHDLISSITPAKSRKLWQRDFEKIAREDARRCAQINEAVSNLPSAAWTCLRDTVLGQIDLRDPARGWQQAIPLLYEARAHDYLVGHGYHDVEFLIAQARAKSPDLRATRDGKILLCEVKTLRVARRDSLIGNLRMKLAKRVEDAAQQLTVFSDAPNAARMIYFVLDISDDLQSTASEIREQIELLVAEVDLGGISIVVDGNAVANYDLL